MSSPPILSPPLSDSTPTCSSSTSSISITPLPLDPSSQAPTRPLDPLHRFTTTDLVPLTDAVARRITNLVDLGDALLESDLPRPVRTRFEAQSKPSMGVHPYLTRIITLCPIPVDGLLLGLSYLDRIASPAGRRARDVPLNALTVHRLMLSCFMLGTKFGADGLVSRKRASKVGGVSEAELDGLERELLSRLQFELCWRTDELSQLATEVLEGSSAPLPDTTSVRLPPRPVTGPPKFRRDCWRTDVLSRVVDQVMEEPERSLGSDPIATSIILAPPARAPVRKSVRPKPNQKIPVGNFRRDATTNGIVFSKSQFVASGSRLLPVLGEHHRRASVVEFQCLVNHSMSEEQIKRHTSKASSSTIVVTKLERNRLTISHSQVY